MSDGAVNEVGRAGRRIAMVFVAVVAAVVLASGAAQAAPPAPAWLPSSPIMAGPQVILLFVPSPGAAKYKVYLDGKFVGETAVPQYAVPAPESPGEHKYEVSGVDASGAEGPKSRPGIINIVVMTPPKDLSSRVSGNVVALRWGTVPGAIIYDVYRADKKDGEYKMLSSVQGDGYTDTTLQAGKTYYFSVSAKDMSGKSSARSAPLEVTAVVEKAVGAAKSIPLKAVSSVEQTSLSFVGRNSLKGFGFFKIGADGRGYISDINRPSVMRVDLASGDVTATYGKGGSGPGEYQSPTGIAVTRNGAKVFVGTTSGKINVYDGEGAFLHDIPLFAPDLAKNPDIYKNAIAYMRGKTPNPGGLALDESGDTLLAAVPAYHTIYKFSLDGKFKGFFGSGAQGEQALALPGEVELTPDGKLMLVLQAVAHDVRVFDYATGKRIAIIGPDKDGYIGGFLGIAGMAIAPDGNLIFCDPGYNTIQVFDRKSFQYLYHVGGATPQMDPNVSDRVVLDEMKNVSSPAVDKAGNLYVFNGADSSVSVRKVSWSKPVELKKPVKK